MFTRSNVNVSDEDNSDAESSASSLSPSEKTSRATPADSWYDVKSDTEQQRQQSNPLKNRASIGSQEHHESVSMQHHDTDSDEEDEEAVAHGNPPLASSGQSETKPWTNPYWSSDGNSHGTTTNESANNQR